MEAKHTATPWERKRIPGWGDAPCITTVGGARPLLQFVRDEKYYTDYVKDADGSTILSEERARAAGNYVATPETRAQIIAQEEATAEFIVRACNAHDDLVEALRRATEALYNADYQELTHGELMGLINGALSKATGSAA